MFAIFAQFVAAGSVMFAPADDAMTNARLETMLKDGDDAMLVATFKRHSDEVLPFIDSYLEGGLKEIEDGAGRGEALNSFRTGVQFAGLADEAFNQTIFTEYAASFASWSPQEQKAFREGQRLYREGKALLEKNDSDNDSNARQALKLFEQSLNHAEPLFDHWGTAMAYDGLAQARYATKQYAASDEAAANATRLYHELRLRMPGIKTRLISARARAKLGLPDSGLGHLRSAWNTLKDSDPVELRRKVLSEYLSALERTGRFDTSEQLRTENSALFKE